MGKPANNSILARAKVHLASDRVFPYVVTLAYFVGALFVILHHEIWRDEFIPWMTGRASNSLSELIWNIRYEGHAPGWYVIVYFVTWFARVPEAMQITHLLIAICSVFLLLRFSPIPRVWRVLYAFGFYPFYQYAVISRGYALCVLLLFAFCVLFQYRRTKLLLLSAVLCLLALADTYGWLMSASLAATLAYARAYDGNCGNAWTNSRLAMALSALIIAFGLAWSAIVSMPPADTGTYTDWHTTLSWQRLLHVIYSLSFSYNFLSESIYPTFSVLALLITIPWFARRRVPLFMFASFLFAVAAFYYLKFDIVVFWHKGMVFEYLIACIWVYYYYADAPFQRRLAERVTLSAQRWSSAMVAAILLFFVAYGIKWEWNDITRPYTCGKAVARYVQAHFPGDMVIAGDSDFAATSMVGYLDRAIYYPASDRNGTYLLYDNKRHWPITMDELYTRVRGLSAKTSREVLLVLAYELPPEYVRRLDARLVRQFGGSVMVDENFWLYMIPPPSGPSDSPVTANEGT